MNDRLLFGLTLAAALGCGLLGGAFFAFSSFVMKALGRLPASQGIAAMQSINIVVINPWFVDPASADGAGLWAGYLASWTAWNHVRALAAVAASAVLSLSLSR